MQFGQVCLLSSRSFTYRKKKPATTVKIVFILIIFLSLCFFTIFFLSLSLFFFHNFTHQERATTILKTNFYCAIFFDLFFFLFSLYHFPYFLPYFHLSKEKTTTILKPKFSFTLFSLMSFRIFLFFYHFPYFLPQLHMSKENNQNFLLSYLEKSISIARENTTINFLLPNSPLPLSLLSRNITNYAQANFSFTLFSVTTVLTSLPQFFILRKKLTPTNFFPHFVVFASLFSLP